MSVDVCYSVTEVTIPLNNVIEFNSPLIHYWHINLDLMLNTKSSLSQNLFTSKTKSADDTSSFDQYFCSGVEFQSVNLDS